MVLKIFKAVWFLSLVAALVVLLLVYASLPEKVVVQEEGAKLVSLSREAVFYLAMSIMALSNVLVYAIARVYARDEDFRTWFYGFVITLNIFFIIALNLINLFNTGERFDYSRIDFVIYGSVALVILWAIVWPFYSIYRKFFHKQSV